MTLVDIPEQVIVRDVENVLNEITQTKKLCFDCVQEYVDTALWLFPIYISDAKTCGELFTFFHIVFDVLKSQMGAEGVERAIQTFFHIRDGATQSSVSRQCKIGC